jgi:hypothetical protein
MADLGESQPHGGATRGVDRGGAILAELAEALASALLGLAEEQRLAMAERVAAIAEAARSAARSLDRSESSTMARSVDRAADGIADLSRIVRERSWREIAAETAEFARFRPGLFGLGAIALGFLAGRLLLPEPRGAPVETASETRGASGLASSGGKTAADRDDGAGHRQTS